MGEFDVQLRRIRSSRFLKLRVYPDGKVVLTAPPYASQVEIEKFIANNKEWIQEKRQKIIDGAQSLTQNREKLFFRGVEFDFRLNVTSNKPKVETVENRIIVHTPNEDHQTVRQILEKWYRTQAENRFKERVPLLSDLVGKDLMKVTIRSQRSRWGSCSSRNTISLNWRLIMAPDWVSDYVIYHELAHLTHMNHSKAFWQLVAQYIPKHKDAESWLKKHHQLLQF